MPKKPVPLGYSTPLSQKEPILTKVLAIVDFLLLLSGCALSFGSAFAFDAPGSEHHIGTWVMVVTSVALPVTAIIAILIAASLTNSGNHRGAQLILLLPLADLLVFAVGVAFFPL